MLLHFQSYVLSRFNGKTVYSQVSSYWFPLFSCRWTIQCACHPPRDRTLTYRLLAQHRSLIHAAYPYTRTLHNNGRPPMYKRRSRVFYHPYTILDTCDHRSKCIFPFPPYCYQAIHLHSVSRLAMSRLQYHWFCFLASHLCIDYHRSSSSYLYHACGRTGNLHRSDFCRSRSQHLYHATNRPSILLRT